MEQKLGCYLIRADPEKEIFCNFKAINKIFRYIKQWSNQLTEKTLMDKISLRLLRLEFKSNNATN